MSLQTYCPNNASYIIIIFSRSSTSRHFDLFVWNSLQITLSLHLRGQVVTKGREIIIFAKNQPLFDGHRQYVDISLIDFLLIS